jgi:hypothetical protein
MYIVGKYKINIVLAAKQARNIHQMFAFLPISKACTNKFYILQQ